MEALRWQRRMYLLAIAVMLASALVSTCGCSTTAVGEPEDRGMEDRGMEGRFEAETVSSGFNYSLTVVTDTEEGCQYLFLKSGYGAGFVQLTDKYGNPLLADGYSRREVGMSDDDGE